MLRAALLDVGGTLWPDHPTGPASVDPCVELARLLPELEPSHVLTVLRDALRTDARFLVQDTHGVLTRALRAVGVDTDALDVVAIRRALCAPAVPGVQLFPGAAELLAGLKALGLRNVIVSNVQVRGTLEYWRDFTDLGVAQLIDAVVTSLDVGFRKPHPAFFEAALREASCAPSACVVIGNSEPNDIRPAVALGMRTIRVAIEEPPPTSMANVVAADLESVLRNVRAWIRDG